MTKTTSNNPATTKASLLDESSNSDDASSNSILLLASTVQQSSKNEITCSNMAFISNLICASFSRVCHCLTLFVFDFCKRHTWESPNKEKVHFLPQLRWILEMMLLWAAFAMIGSIFLLFRLLKWKNAMLVEPGAYLNRNILITGGGTGVGRELALQYAQGGATLAICGRRKEPLEKTSEECMKRGASSVLVISCDVTHPQQTKAMIDDIQEVWGHLDTLVLNAGVSQNCLFTDVDDSLAPFHAIMEVNCVANIRLMHFCLPLLLKAKRARVIFNSSVAAICGAPFRSFYSCSKAGTEAFLDSLRLELASYKNLTITKCVPFFTTTKTIQRLGEGGIVRPQLTKSPKKCVTPERCAREMRAAGELGLSAHVIGPAKLRWMWLLNVPVLFPQLVVREALKVMKEITGEMQ